MTLFPSLDSQPAQPPRDDRARLDLMAASPLRTTRPQDDVDGLPIFDATRSPGLGL